VRFFGVEREVIVPMEVEMLRKSCFESCSQLERIDFEDGSRLKKIGKFAIASCISLWYP
jgi:hypothetical protein